MKYFGTGLSEKHKELNKIIRQPVKLEQAKSLFLDIHANLNVTENADQQKNEVDILLDGLTKEDFAIMPTEKDETIAWALWHVARIEDLTMNILVARQEQLFNNQWQERMNTPIRDTGNALTDDEIMDFSKRINIRELLCYRKKVAEKTRAIVADLTAEDMKRKIHPADLEKILTLGGVTKQENSLWLLEYWRKKDVAGLLLMPPTRHVLLHLNNCCKWKEAIRSKKNFYRS